MPTPALMVIHHGHLLVFQEVQAAALRIRRTVAEAAMPLSVLAAAVAAAVLQVAWAAMAAAAWSFFRAGNTNDIH